MINVLPSRLFVFYFFVFVLYSFLFPSRCLAKPPEKFYKPASPSGVLLIDAVRNNDAKDVRAKLKSGAKVDAQDDQGNTALHLAVFANTKPIVRLLLKAGADVNARNEFGLTPLHLVKDKTIARMLVARGADVNAKDTEFGMTPLFFQDVSVAEVLVKAGADVNARGKKGDTPLIWYAYNNYLAGMKFLLAHGANPDAVNDEGSTAFSVAARFGNRKLVNGLQSLPHTEKTTSP